MIVQEHSIFFKYLSIGYRYQGQPVMVQENLSGTACKGELVALVGANGTGKSTLLRTLSGLLPCLEGSITLQGISLTDIKREEMAKVLAFVSTLSQVPDTMSVSEIISLGRFPYTNWIGQFTNKDREIIGKVSEDMGVKDLLTRISGELSDGERQKVMIARALAQEPEVLVLDEPTAYLDLPNRYELVRVLRKLTLDKKLCVVFSTHDLQVAMKEADKIWLMPGVGLKEGAPEDLVLDGSFGKLFGNSPLLFNEKDSTWSLPRSGKVEVNVLEKGRQATFIHNLLDRLGIVDTTREGIPVIRAIESQGRTRWQIEEDDKHQSFTTIYGLGQYLKQLLNKQ